ncbi:hypothetical protein ANCDUO_22227, partial [Ancylostoma duodenale]
MRRRAAIPPEKFAAFAVRGGKGAVVHIRGHVQYSHGLLGNLLYKMMNAELLERNFGVQFPEELDGTLDLQ